MMRCWSSASMIWKLCGSFALAPVTPQEAVRETVKRADPEVLDRQAEQ